MIRRTIVETSIALVGLTMPAALVIAITNPAAVREEALDAYKEARITFWKCCGLQTRQHERMRPGKFSAQVKTGDHRGRAPDGRSDDKSASDGGDGEKR